MFRLVNALIATSFLAFAVTAQEPTKPADGKPLAAKKVDSAPAGALATVDPAEVEVHFLNGSLLRLLVHSEKLEIDTEYGRLVVPVRDVRTIEFGLRYPDGAQAKIQAALNELGGGDFRTRDKAVKTLVELGPYSYPATLEASRSKILEVSQRAKQVLKQLEGKFSKADLKTTEMDKVVARSFPINGRILTSTLKARTDLFGDVELSLAKMGTLKSIAAPGAGVDTNVTIDATKYAILGQWMETSTQVDGRTALTITAKGAVDTWPQGPGQYMTGPNGAGGGRVMIQGGGGIVVGGAGRNIAQLNLQMNGGALYGRIGEDGEPFFIGERYNGTPESEGKLYLTIAPSPWGCMSTGKYDVKIAR